MKGTALSQLASFGDRVASIDSQAYGIAARREAYAAGRSRSGSMVAGHMERWTARQQSRASRCVPAQTSLDLDVVDLTLPDPWEQALADARQEIRELIADGEIGHDRITAALLFDWAADDMTRQDQ